MQEMIESFTRVCSDGFAKGWHERNGGNLTYRVKAEEISGAQFAAIREWQDIGVPVPELAGEFFLTTGSGKYFRNVEIDAKSNIGIAEIDGKGERFRIVWGLENGARPTSELPTHLMNHAVRKRVTGGKNRVIYHAHPANVIALTFVLPLEDKAFTQPIWQSATECAVVFPEGIGVVPWMVPGGREIAVATGKLMETYQAAVWAHHGLFCSGSDFDETFGLMDTIEKAAEIYVKVLSTGKPILQTIENADLLAIGTAFGVTINENLL